MIDYQDNCLTKGEERRGLRGTPWWSRNIDKKKKFDVSSIELKN